MAKTKKFNFGSWYKKVSFWHVFTIMVVSFLVLLWTDVWSINSNLRRTIYVVTDLKYMLDVPDDEKQICMDWAYGVGWEWCLTGDMDRRWNEKHCITSQIDRSIPGATRLEFRMGPFAEDGSYPFWIYGTDSPYDTQQRISEYWNTIGGE